jgi:surfeit locus 1 family protein
MHFRQYHIRFTPSLIPTLAALVALAATLYLATWQQGRASEKRALQAEFDLRERSPQVVIDAATRDANGLRYRNAVARGQWQTDGQIFIDNKIDASGRAGYHVITPLRLSDASSTYVLVNRGWVARAANYPQPPRIATSAGDVEIHGMITLPNTKFLELAPNANAGQVWQNLTIERYVESTKRDVLPFVLLASVPSDTQFLPVIERPDARVDKHIEYMLTWYSLAVTVVALWVGLNLHITHQSNREAA